MTDDELAARLREVFTEELDEALRELNGELLALERTPGDAERLSAVFRVMHTLKGASRAAGIPQAEQVCHVLESELGRARDQRLPLTGVQIALLFEAADALGDLRDRLRAGAKGESDALLTVLRHAGERRADASPRAPSPPPDAVPAPTSASPRTDAAPAPPAAPRSDSDARTPDESRLPVIRVSLNQVDAIAGFAGEIAGITSALHERTDGLAALQARIRATSGDGASGSGDRPNQGELTRLLRCLRDDVRSLSGVSERLSTSARRLRQRPVRDLTEPVPRLIRDVARDLGREVRLTVEGGDIEADRAVLEALRDPLLHLVRNAIDHGIEPESRRVAQGKPPEGEIRIRAVLRGDRLRITVSDDGPGLDLGAIQQRLQTSGRAVPGEQDLLMRTILADGFTTRQVPTTVSGRGVGLAVVRAAAERMGGAVEIDSTRGHGMAITLDVPLSVATMRALLVRVGDSTLAIPSAAVVRVLRLKAGTVTRVDGRLMVPVQGKATPVRTLASLLGPPFIEREHSRTMQGLMIESAGRRLVLVVDDLVDERELMLRPVEHGAGGDTAWTVGSALLGSGNIALVLNAAALVDEERGTSGGSAFAAAASPARKSRILVADDSMTSRTLEASVLSAAGYDVTTAVDGAAAWRIIDREPLDLVVSDVEMPHLDGFALCERIRANQRTARLPVVLVTSLDSDEQRGRGLAAGADAYITKSGFDQDTLLDTVRMLIGSHARESV